MKFVEASADIPNELIRTVNDGEVVFLCGAGVSKGVGLPLFQDLTDTVYTKLGESRDNEAAERIAYGRAEYDRVLGSLEKRTHLPGTDSRVQAAVSETLAPPDGAVLSRHLSLLRLSRDRDDRPRLLTTNFDTLFERQARSPIARIRRLRWRRWWRAGWLSSTTWVVTIFSRNSPRWKYGADSGPSRTVIPAHCGQQSGDCGQFLMSV